MQTKIDKGRKERVRFKYVEREIEIDKTRDKDRDGQIEI